MKKTSDDKSVMVLVDQELLRDIRAALRECAEDLDIELDARYPEETRNQFPSEMRRWRRDRASVIDAMYCDDRLAELDKDGTRNE